MLCCSKGDGDNFGQILFFFTMLYDCISNDKIQFDSQSLTFKQDTELTSLCHVNKPRVLFFFT